jgi:hypothetical protein
MPAWIFLMKFSSESNQSPELRLLYEYYGLLYYYRSYEISVGPETTLKTSQWEAWCLRTPSPVFTTVINPPVLFSAAHGGSIAQYTVPAAIIWQDPYLTSVCVRRRSVWMWRVSVAVPVVSIVLWTVCRWFEVQACTTMHMSDFVVTTY